MLPQRGGADEKEGLDEVVPALYEQLHDLATVLRDRGAMAEARDIYNLSLTIL